MTHSTDFTEADGSSLDQSTFDNTSRNVKTSFGGQRGAVPASRPHANSFPYLNGAASSRHSPRGGSRSSGLRQELTSVNKSLQSQEQPTGPYQAPPSPSKPPRLDSRPISRNSSGNFDTAHSTPFVSASQPGTPSGIRNPTFKEMEDSLRRILKLEPVTDASAQVPGISRMPEATVSVPNYVSGRAPAMNGMHNGVVGS